MSDSSWEEGAVPLCAVVCCSLLIGLRMLCALQRIKGKKKYTFGYLNEEASWSCVGVEGGGCGMLSPELLALVMEGQGCPCPQPVPPRQEGCASPSLTGEAPSQL